MVTTFRTRIADGWTFTANALQSASLQCSHGDDPKGYSAQNWDDHVLASESRLLNQSNTATTALTKGLDINRSLKMAARLNGDRPKFWALGTLFTGEPSSKNSSGKAGRSVHRCDDRDRAQSQLLNIQ